MNKLSSAFKVLLMIFFLCAQFTGIAMEEGSEDNPEEIGIGKFLKAFSSAGFDSLPDTARVLFFSPKISDESNRPNPVSCKSRLDPLLSSIETTCKIYITYSDGKMGWSSATLLNSEWAVTIDSWINDSEKDSPKTLHYVDSEGNAYSSSIDKYVLVDEKMQESLPPELHRNKYCDFRIAFVHLEDPIEIKTPPIDMRPHGALLKERAVIVGYDWPAVTIKGQIGNIPERVRFEPPELLGSANTFISLLDCPKTPTSFSLYSIRDYIALIQVLVEIDGCIDININQREVKYSDQNILSFLPYGNNLDIREDRIRALTCKLALLLCNPEGKIMKDALKLGDFLCGVTGASSLSKRHVFHTQGKSGKNKSNTKEAKNRCFNISFPEIREGDGMIDQKDSGGGVYTLFPDGGYQLSGIVLATNQAYLDYLTIDNQKRLDSFVIVPMSYLYPLFEKICLGKTSTVKPFSTKELSKKKKKKKSRSKHKIEAACNTPLSNSLSSSEEGGALPVVQKKSIIERLKNTHWAAIVKKTETGGRSYKETYFFSLLNGGQIPNGGGCKHSVGMLAHLCILGDHTSNGTWHIDDENPDRLIINLAIENPKPRSLTFVFDITETGETIHLRETRGDRKKEDDFDATGKERSDMILKQLSPKTKNPLSVFSNTEKYQGIISLFPSHISLHSDCKIELYQQESKSFPNIDSLCGYWYHPDSSSAPTSFFNIEKRYIGDTQDTVYIATSDKASYCVVMKKRYDIRDFKLNKPGYILRFIPLDESSKPIDLGIYYHPKSQLVILSTPEVSMFRRKQKQYKLINPPVFYTKI